VIALPLPIETSRLRLRSLVPGDDAALHAFQSRPDVARWTYSEPRSQDEVREALERQIARARDAPETGVPLAVDVMATNELIGHVSITLGPPAHRQAEIGFMFHPAHHGRGYATEASAALLGLAFDTYDLHRVYGRIEPRNVASARVLEKLGMRKEAHLVENEWVKGEWQSEAVYALLAREWRGGSGALVGSAP
jgi:RimJ/RimL family protein N-acetyltransferase